MPGSLQQKDELVSKALSFDADSINSIYCIILRLINTLRTGYKCPLKKQKPAEINSQAFAKW
jgi:hypothetical protein